MLATLDEKAIAWSMAPKHEPIKEVWVVPALVRHVGRVSGVLDADIDGLPGDLRTAARSTTRRSELTSLLHGRRHSALAASHGTLVSASQLRAGRRSVVGSLRPTLTRRSGRSGLTTAARGDVRPRP